MSKVMQQRLLFSFLMSGVMAFLIGAWVTFINLGLISGYIFYWMKAFLLAWPAGFVVVTLLAPTVQRLTQSLLTRWHSDSTPFTKKEEL